MEEKIKVWICQAFNAVLLAGIILFFIGLYYLIIKAGIPYQDPPLELQIRYAVNYEIGDILVKTGVAITLISEVSRLIWGLVLKNQRKK